MKRALIVLALGAFLLILPYMLVPTWFIAKYGSKPPPAPYDKSEPVPLALDIYGVHGADRPPHMPQSFEAGFRIEKRRDPRSPPTWISTHPRQ